MQFLLNESPVPFRPIYLDEHENFVVVDDEDYGWALQWGWNIVLSRPNGYRPRKMYARRGTRKLGVPISVYMHKEICRRAHGPPPSPLHIIGDHKDGKSLNCRRDNLRWATRKENAMNLYGDYALQQRMFNGDV